MLKLVVLKKKLNQRTPPTHRNQETVKSRTEQYSKHRGSKKIKGNFEAIVGKSKNIEG